MHCLWLLSHVDDIIISITVFVLYMYYNTLNAFEVIVEAHTQKAHSVWK